jgi:ribonucleotide reductase alpha subunit
LIRGTNGPSSGIIPMLKVYNEIARYVDQGGKRKGSVAIYLEPHHSDIMPFLELRKNFGAETERARDLFLAVWVSDLFMKQVEADADWYLMCPDKCPGLTEAYGEAYEKLYWSYVEQNRYNKKIKARDVMKAILDSQLETGTPYLGFKDHINNKSNQKNIGTIKSSNLCVHENTVILTDQGNKNIKSLKDSEVNVWNGYEWSKVTVKQTGSNQDLIRVSLSNGSFLDCTPEHKFYIIEDLRIARTRAMNLNVNDRLIEFKMPNGLKIENVYVTSVEESFKNVDTYCFTEPLRNMGVFNGILTGQCHEIVEYSDENEYAVCNLASIALNKCVVPFKNTKKWKIYTKDDCKYCKWAKAYLTNTIHKFEEEMVDSDKLKEITGLEKPTYPQIYYGTKLIGGYTELYNFIKGTFDYDKLYDIAYTATVNLNNIIDNNYYPVIEAKRSNIRHRPIAVGIQGLADALVLLKIQFDSD